MVHPGRSTNVLKIKGMNDMAGKIRENEAELEAVIEKIVRKAVDIMPEDWYEALVGYFLVGEELYEHQQVVAFCKSSTDYRDLMKESWEDFDMQDGILDIKDLFREMHTLCSAAGDNWAEVTVSVKRSGAFQVDYVYEPITEYDNFFITDWLGRYLA